MHLLPFIILSLCLIVLLVERYVIQRAIRTLPIRILVNGTRGKSTVTRYIAAALRAAGKRPFAKITGIIPTIIAPDGTSLRLKRVGPPRVQEQLKMLSKAKRSDADSIVLECMSLTPENQEIESKILQPTITVITNIREDHIEQMGETDADRIAAMSHSIGSKTTVFMHESDRKEFLELCANRQRSTIEYVKGSSLDLENCSSADQENISIALSVSSMLGIDKSVALQAIQREIDAKEKDRIEIETNNGRVHFINCFAINDTPSAETALNYWKEEVPYAKNIVIILNTRADRPIRSKLFAQWCANHKDDVWRVIVTGTHSLYVVSTLKKFGVPKEKIQEWNSEQSVNAKVELISMVTEETLAIGIGNYAGDGFSIFTALQKKVPPYDH